MKQKILVLAFAVLGLAGCKNRNFNTSDAQEVKAGPRNVCRAEFTCNNVAEKLGDVTSTDGKFFEYTDAGEQLCRQDLMDQLNNKSICAKDNYKFITFAWTYVPFVDPKIDADGKATAAAKAKELADAQRANELSSAAAAQAAAAAAAANAVKPEMPRAEKALERDLWLQLVDNKVMKLSARSTGGQRYIEDDQSIWKSDYVYREIGTDEMCQVSLTLKQSESGQSFSVKFSSSGPAFPKVTYEMISQFFNRMGTTFFSQRDFLQSFSDFPFVYDIFFDKDDNSLSFISETAYKVSSISGKRSIYLKLNADRSKIAFARMSFVPKNKTGNFVSFIDCGEFN